MHSERPQPPHVRAVAPARRGRHHHARSTSRSRSGPGTPSSRRSAATPAVWKPSPKTAALRDRRAAHLQPGAGAARPAGDLPAVHRRRHDARRRASSTTGASRSSRSPARPRSAADVGERVAAAPRQEPARARRQQRDHRRRDREPRSRRARHRLRRGRHGRPALHDDAPPVRARVVGGGARAAPRRRPTSRCASATRSMPGTLMGPLIDARAVEQLRGRARPGARGGRRAARAAASVLTGAGLLRRADDRARPQRMADRADARPSRRSCT